MFRRTYLTPNVGSSSRFFHLWQIFSRDPCVPGASIGFHTMAIANDSLARRSYRHDGSVPRQHCHHRSSWSLRGKERDRLSFRSHVVRPIPSLAPSLAARLY